MDYLSRMIMMTKNGWRNLPVKSKPMKEDEGFTGYDDMKFETSASRDFIKWFDAKLEAGDFENLPESQVPEGGWLVSRKIN